MSDLLAGQVVRSADWPATRAAGDSTVLSNLTNTAFATGSPVVATTFTAPTSGRVKITVGGGLRDNGGINRIVLAPQVFLGTNASGTEVLGLTNTVFTELTSPGQASSFYYMSRSSVLDGLTPGATYYARLMHKVSGGSTADITRRDIMIRALP